MEKIRAIASERGGVCLSENYTRALDKMRFRCSLGHLWEAAASKIKSGQWCPSCCGRNRNIEYMRRFAESIGGLCLSEKYFRCNVKLRWRCKDGHEWDSAPQSMLKHNGSWCPICGRTNAGLNRRTSVEEWRELARARGGECLSETTANAGKKLEWRCSHGHTWFALSGSIGRGSWCPICANAQRGSRKRA